MAKLHTTGSTFIRLFSCVLSFVDMEIGFQSEALPAVWTLVWFLPTVDQLVIGQKGWACESLTAFFTHIRLSLQVHQGVPLQTGLDGEALITLVTLEGFVTGVPTHVCVEMLQLCVRLTTLWALVRKVLSPSKGFQVDVHVPVKVLTLVEALAAVLAAVAALVGVCAVVLH